MTRNGFEALLILALSLVLSLPIAGVSAASTGPKEEKKPKTEDPKEQAGGAPEVYTNDDLDRLFGTPPPPSKPAAGLPAPDSGIKLPDPLKAIDEEQARAESRKVQIAAAEKELAAAQSKVKALENRALVITSPLDPLPQPSPEEIKEWEKLGSPAYLKRTQDELRLAREDLEKARAKLAKLRAE